MCKERSQFFLSPCSKIIRSVRNEQYQTVLQMLSVRIGHGIADWFQIEKGVIEAVYCQPAFLICMQSTSSEMLGWMKHKLESRLLGEISITSDMHMTLPLWQKEKKN